ncbi:hypothetical protein GCM10010347_33180 [Streptomyces cirratus]|uniref:Uncharacterized protein n=1 Tax=Streptomyces cirratus TaxID=68187 RepID=A0ABQ3ETG1_9ACTN|nr:hypothetical protein GCM10010347_33180 [Streptomyces cirratus]
MRAGWRWRGVCQEHLPERRRSALQKRYNGENDKQLKSFTANLAKGDALEVSLMLGVASPGEVYEVTPELEILKGGKHEFLRIPNAGGPFKVAGDLASSAPGINFGGGGDSNSLPAFPKA